MEVEIPPKKKSFPDKVILNGLPKKKKKTPLYKQAYVPPWPDLACL